jgi:branched-subunit amino acid transport protein
MSDLWVIVAMAAITYASRAVFLLWPRSIPEGYLGRFLELFPLALFVSIATLGLAAPEGEIDATIALVAAAGGLVGGWATKRSFLGVAGFGIVAWWIARAVV